MSLAHLPDLTIGARISLLVLVIAASVAMMGALVIAALAAQPIRRTGSTPLIASRWRR